MKGNVVPLVSLHLRKHLQLVLVALATLAFSCLFSTSAFSSPVLSFLERPDDTGIDVSVADSGVGNPVVTPQGPVFVAGEIATICRGTGCTINNVMGFGSPALAAGDFVNIFEPDGITLSDQLQFSLDANNQPLWTFVSDTNFITTGTPLNSIIENGAEQVAFTYTNGQGGMVTINISSPVSVPEPASLSLLLLGLAGLGFVRRKKA